MTADSGCGFMYRQPQAFPFGMRFRIFRLGSSAVFIFAIPPYAPVRADDVPIAVPTRLQTFGTPTPAVRIDYAAGHFKYGNGRGAVVIP